MTIKANQIDMEIAKELTLAIISRIQPTDRTTPTTMNNSLAQEVSNAYEIILKVVSENSN